MGIVGIGIGVIVRDTVSGRDSLDTFPDYGIEEEVRIRFLVSSSIVSSMVKVRHCQYFG